LQLLRKLIAPKQLGLLYHAALLQI
jgi:hypothetical protein